MSLLTLSSNASAWRGYEYYKAKKAKLVDKTSEIEIYGTASGSDGKTYNIFIDTAHPRKSKCNCPHADGKRIICKHMIALYFTAFPNEAKKYYDEVMAYEEDQDRRQEEIEEQVLKCIDKMKKDELRQLALRMLFEGPEWQYDRFVRDYIELQ